MISLLAGDIGGTKTILQLVQKDKSDSPLTPIYTKRYGSHDFPDLVPMVQQFLADARSHSEAFSDPERACFAIAGPVVNQRAQLTNLPWQLDSLRLERELNLQRAQLINDFAAVGYGILHLPPDDLRVVQAGDAQPQAPIAVAGAGTGLGQAFLIWQTDRYQVYGSEGSHADFAPRTDLEWQLCQYLQRLHGRVSVERVVSGLGIVAIYQFLRASGHGSDQTPLAKAIQEWEIDPSSCLDPAAEISRSAQEEADPVAQQALDLFVSAYGAEVGNLALKILPYGGIYIAGGIAAKLLALMQKGAFLESFLDKGRMRSILERIPISIILNAQVGLLGAAVCAAD